MASLAAIDLSGKSEEEIARIVARGTGHPWKPRDWTSQSEADKTTKKEL